MKLLLLTLNIDVYLYVYVCTELVVLFQLRFEYFVAVAIAVIVILILILIAVAVLLIRFCRKRAKKATSVSCKEDQKLDTPKKTPISSTPAKMPKHIRMGTGLMSAASMTSSQLTTSGNTSDSRPDLVTDHSDHGSSKRSTMTGTISSDSSNEVSQTGSYRMAMENIIDDYR